MAADGCNPAGNAFQAPACSDTNFLDEHLFDYYSEGEGFADPVQVGVNGPSVTQPTALNMGATSSTTGGLFAQVGVKDNLSLTLGGTIETGSRDEIAALRDMNGDGLVDEIIQDASGALHVLYNEQNTTTLFPNRYAAAPDRQLVGLSRIGYEGHGSWSIKGAVEFGVSVSGSYSDSTSQGKARLVDIDGDGYTDYLGGASRFGLPCEDGMCFGLGDYGAPSGIDPRQDPVLADIAADLARRLILADPVVQWQAPRAGRAVITGTARRLVLGSSATVTVQVYRGDTLEGDTLVTELPLSWLETAEASFSVGELDLNEGDIFYVRIKSGGLTVDGNREPLVDANLHIEYQTDCSGPLGCRHVSLPLPHEPTGTPLYSFDARGDFRVAGAPTFVVAPVTGKLRLGGTLHKAVTAADVRACVQVLPAVIDGQPPSFVEPCDSESSGVRNVSGTFRLNAGQVAAQVISTSVDVTAGQLVMLRIESDFSFDPAAIRFDPLADARFVAYEQVCLPAAGQEACSGDPGAIASVALPSRSTKDFGPYIALAGYTATPLVAFENTVVTVEAFAISDPRAVFAIRSDRQGTIAQYDCSSVDCGNIDPPSFQVTAGESISFEIVGSSNVFSLPSSVSGTIAGSAYQAAVGRSARRLPLGNIGPFIGGYHGWRAGLWNEAERFAPTQLIQDYEDIEQVSAERQLQILRSAVMPLPTFGHDPVVGIVSSWRGADSTAYVSAHALSAGYIGLVPDGASGSEGGGLLTLGYTRLSGTISKTIGISSRIVNVRDIFGVSFSINAGSSETVTTTDALDMNGDGILDVLAGKRLTLGALTSDPAGREQLTDFIPNGGFRKRHSIDYGIGIGGSVVPYTTSSGRTTMMGRQKDPGIGIGFGTSTGIAIQRSATTDDILDVNDDGLPDVVRRDGNNIRVRLNLGNRLGAWETFGHVEDALRMSIDTFESAERSLDWIPLVGEAVDTGSKSLDHDTTITQHTTESLDLLVYSRSTTTSITASRTTRQLADLNGDGLPDLLVKKADENVIHVQYNLGSTFSEPDTWAVPAWPSEVELSPIFNSRVSELALTGPDVLAGTGSQIAKSTSNSIAIPIPGTPILVGGEYTTADSIDTYELALLDIDGDASPDHVLKRASGNGVTFWVKRNRANGKGNLLQTVHGPLGGSFTLDYKRTPNTVEMPQSRYVLSQVQVDDAVDLGPEFASPDLVTTIEYEHGIYQRHEKEFYGFENVTSTRADGTSTEQIYSNDPSQYVLRGRLRAEIRRDPKELALERRDFSYAVLDVIDDSGQRVTSDAACTDHQHPLLAREPAACRPSFAVVVQDTNTWFEQGTRSKTRTRRTLASDFDRFGNELASVDEGDDAITSDDVFSRATYRNDTTNWILGRPTLLEVRAGSPSGTLLRSRRADYDSVGDLAAVHIDTGMVTATTHLGYDVFGNLNHVETPPNHRGQTQTFDVIYDAEAATYPVSTRNGFNETSSAEYDLRFGVATRETSVNGQSMTRMLDAFGRVVAVQGPFDTTGPGLEMSYVLNEPKRRAVTVTHPAAPPGYTGTLAPITTVTVVDGFGRTIEQRKTAVVGGVLGMTTSGLVQRDIVDRVVREYQPFFTGVVSDGFEPPKLTKFTTTLHDAHDRPLVVTYPDNAHDTFEYAIEPAPLPSGPWLLATKTTAANGNKRESYADLLGHVRAFVEHPTIPDDPTPRTAISQYDYLPTGELVRITDAEGNATTLGYDLRGLRTSLNNPDTGLVEERFDPMGNRVVVVEPNHRALGAEVGFVFDRNRVIGVNYPSKRDVSMTYGTAGLDTGRLVRIDDESGSQVHTYGRQGELVRTVRTVVSDGQQPLVFDTQFTVDSLGRQLAVRYPDGVTIKSTYDSAGMLERVYGAGAGWTKTYASELKYDVFGNRIHMRSGNGVATTWSYDPERIRLKTIDTTLPGATARPIQALRYKYDPSGNPEEIKNELPALFGGSGQLPGDSTVSFVYDGVDRLLRAEGSAQFTAQKRTMVFPVERLTLFSNWKWSRVRVES